MAKYRSFKTPLSAVFAEEKTEGKPVAGMELMADIYEKIRMAAEDMDCDQLERIFADMEEYSIPESEAALYEELRTASSRFDYEAILKLLAEKQC